MEFYCDVSLYIKHRSIILSNPYSKALMGHIRHRINYLKDGKNDKMLMVEHTMSIMLPEQRNGNVPQCEYFSSFPVNMCSVPSMDDLWND